MSQPAPDNGPSIMGNTARALSFGLPRTSPGNPQPAQQGERSKPRTRLSLVVSTPRRSRAPFIVISFVLVVAALAAVLMMSVSLSKGQYELVSLKAQQSTLTNSNQALELDLSAKDAPQSLVAAGAALGMVPATTTGQIDVRTMKVTGDPVPAKADTKGLVVIAPAEVNKPAPVAPTTASDVPAPASPAAAEAKAGAQEKPDAAAAEAPKAPTQNLNGGTIPAPTQKDS